MAGTEPFYRHHNAGSDTRTNGRLADVVSRRTQRRFEVGTNGHRQTLRVKSRIGFKGDRRTRTAGTGSDNPSRRTESGVLMVQSDRTEQAMNTRDACVTSTCDVALQNTVTCTSHIPEGIQKRLSAFLGNADTPILNTLNQNRTPPA